MYNVHEYCLRNVHHWNLLATLISALRTTISLNLLVKRKFLWIYVKLWFYILYFKFQTKFRFVWHFLWLKSLQFACFPGSEQYRSDCDIKSATNGTENLLYKHQNMDSPNSAISRSPLQMRQASPFPLESTNRRYITAAAQNPQDRHRSSGK